MTTSFRCASSRSPHVLAAVVVLAAIAVPVATSAAIEVVPPTGNAEPAVMDALRVAIESMVTGAASAYDYEVDGRLRVSVDAAGEGQVSIELELTPDDGSQPVRETRVASSGSAAAQARAMTREVIRAAAGRRSATSTQRSNGDEGSPQSERERPALDSPYSRKTALWLSLGPTLSGAVVGGALIGSAFAVDEDAGRLPTLTIGASICGLAFVLGPSLGHFYVHNHKQAAWGLALRTVFSAAAPVFFALSFGAGFDAAMGGGSSGEAEVYAIFGTIFSAASVVSAILDLATIPLAVQRANEKASEQTISAVALAPLIAPGPNGSTTAGLAFSMRF